MSRRIDHSQLEQGLSTLGKSIPINQELKSRLRRCYADRPPVRKNWARPAWAALVGVLLLVALLGGLLESHQALAAGRQVVEQFSFLDLATGQQGAPAVCGQQIYLPLFGRGIARLDTAAVQSGQGLELILEQPVGQVAVSHDGSQLAYTVDSDVYLYSLFDGQTRRLVTGSNEVYYQDPAWSADDQSLLLTKETVEWLQPHGHQTKALEVVQVELVDGSERKLTDGRSPSPSPDGRVLAFERDGTIFVRGLTSSSWLPWMGLRTGEERSLGPGRWPSISPDGQLVALVRTETNQRQLQANARVVEEVSQVYLVNWSNPADQKRLTSNYPHPSLAESDWLAGLPDSGGNLLVPGYFSYYQPVWGDDANSLYVLKDDATGDAGQGLRLMRIALSETGLTSQQVAARWLEAVVNRDQEVARQMMTLDAQQQAGQLFTSNPHPVGFAIIGGGQADGREYVDVLQYLAYTAQPYWEVLQNRLFLQPVERGYLLQSIQTVSRVQVYLRDDAIWLEQAGRRQQLCRLDQFPESAGGQRLGAIAYQPAAERLYLTWQGAASTRIVSWDRQSASASHLITLSDAVVVDLSLSAHPAGQGFVLVNFGDLSAGASRALLVSEADRMAVQTLGRVSHGLWDGQELVCYTDTNGETVRWLYTPATGRSQLWK